MADITLNIGNPVLRAGEHFKISYKTGAVVTNLPNKTDNTPLVVTGLTKGATYIFTITVVQADGKNCDPVTATISIPNDPPPVDPVDPPVDPPPPPNCDCMVVHSAKVQDNCDGTKYLLIEIDPATIAVGCEFKVWYKTAMQNSFIIVSNSNFDLLKKLSIPSVSNVIIKVQMLCCTNNTWMTCYETTDPLPVEGCNCISPPELSLSYTLVNVMGGMNLTYTFTESTPTVPPYTVSFINGGQIVAQQTHTVGGTYTLFIPSVYDSGHLTLESFCGHDDIQINNNGCNGAPIVTAIIRDLTNLRITIVWTGSNISDYDVDVYFKNPLDPHVTATVNSNTNSKVFTGLSAAQLTTMINATVTDMCGSGVLETYP